MIRKVMDAIYPRVGGLDVHEETVMVCLRRLISDGQAESEVKVFKTTSAGLRELSEWLAGWGVTQVAMESTGVYWIPVWNVLEGRFKLTLENAGAPEESARAEGRCLRRRVDRAVHAVRVIAREFRAAIGSPAMASTDAAPDKAGRSTNIGHQPDPQRAGAGQYQALECGVRHYGGEWPGDDQGDE